MDKACIARDEFFNGKQPWLVSQSVAVDGGYAVVKVVADLLSIADRLVRSRRATSQSAGEVPR